MTGSLRLRASRVLIVPTMQMLMSAILMTLFLAGCAVWFKILSRLQAGKPALEWRDIERERPPLLVAIGLIICAFVFQSLPHIAYVLVTGDKELEGLDKVRILCCGNLVSTIFTLVLILVQPVNVISRNWRERARAKGVDPGDFRHEAKIGVWGFVACLLPVYSVIVVTFPLRTVETQHEFIQLIQADSSFQMIAWIAMTAIVLAPVWEEMVFRVIMQGGLQSVLPSWAAIGITSVVFCLVHGFPDSLALFPLALILGYIYHQRHSYAAVVIVHSLFNALNIANVLVFTGAEQAN